MIVINPTKSRLNLMTMAIIFLICFAPANSYALNCNTTDFTKSVFGRLDLIAKGTVTGIQADDQGELSQYSVTFYFDVEKAWKGARPGKKIRITYEKSGGDAFPYREGETAILYAYQHEKEGFKINGCSGLYRFPMSDELRNFMHNPPYVVGADPKTIKHVKKMTEQLNNLEEHTLDQLAD